MTVIMAHVWSGFGLASLCHKVLLTTIGCSQISLGGERGVRKPESQIRVPGRCSNVNNEDEFFSCKTGEHHIIVKSVQNDADSWRVR